MLHVELHTLDIDRDPAPSFPTDAEIRIAEQLRHRLEERYLVATTAVPSLPPHSNDH
jgi:hypothetical protein